MCFLGHLCIDWFHFLHHTLTDDAANTNDKRVYHVDDTYDEGDEPLSELEGLVSLPGGRYSLSLSIPEVFFKYIIGYHGNTCGNIERETKCRLTIPQRGKTGDIGE
jgi:hypothetical protein